MLLLVLDLDTGCRCGNASEFLCRYSLCSVLSSALLFTLLVPAVLVVLECGCGETVRPLHMFQCSRR